MTPDSGFATGLPIERLDPSCDMQALLDGWPYVADELTARKVLGRDGRDKIQMRLELGMLQMEADGRPDGKRPFGFESLLEYFEDQRTRRANASSGSQRFVLDADDCAELRHEALMYYHRYLCLFCVGDFRRMARDTDRNLRVFDLLRDHASGRDDKVSLEPYRPYVLMMNTRAKAGMAAEQRRFGYARRIIEQGIQRIEEVLINRGDAETISQCLEIHSLRELLDEVESVTPPTEEAALEVALEDAVRREDYALAATMRDRLSALREGRAVET